MVTVTSHGLPPGGPPFLIVIVPVMIVPPPDTASPETVGVGPLPFDNVIEAPETNPLPVIVIRPEYPFGAEGGSISVIVTPGNASTSRSTELDDGDSFPAESV